MLRYRATIEIRGINPYVFVTSAQAAQLQTGWRGPMPVIVRLNGLPTEGWHINMMPAGSGDFYLYLNGIIRNASKTRVGDEVAVEVAFDPDYQRGPAHPVPAALAAGLDHDPVAKRSWEALIPSRQKEVLRYLASLKSDAAQARNIEHALRALSGQETRFMGRTWQNGV